MQYRLNYHTIILVCTLLLMGFSAPAINAQEQSGGETLPKKPTFEERLPDEYIKDKPKFFTLTLENDKYGGNGTDANYTNGVRLSYFDVGEKPIGLAEIFEKYIPTFEINDTTSTYYSIGQNLYTPEDTGLRIPDPDDRPYAAFLYGSMGLLTISDNHIDELEATIGVVGPWALGKPTQRFVHHVLDKDDPKGWDSQLENEPGLMLSWQRQWPELYATDIDALHFRLSPHIGATLGNVYTYANTGITLQITPKQFKWQSQPPRVRPSIPGPGFFAVPENKFAWSVFAGTEGRAVARNIFLDGNSFEDSPSVSKKPIVGDLNAGVSFSYGHTQLSYSINWRSKEFDEQDDNTLFGGVSLGFRF